MRAGDRFCKLIKQGFLHLGELRGVHDFEDVFDLVEEHDLFRAVNFGPVTQQTENHLRDVSLDFQSRLGKGFPPPRSMQHPFPKIVLYNTPIGDGTC